MSDLQFSTTESSLQYLFSSTSSSTTHYSVQDHLRSWFFNYAAYSHREKTFDY